MKVRSLFTTIAALVMAALTLVPTVPANGAPTAHQSTTITAGFEPQRPFGTCGRIEWERRSPSEVRIFAFSDDLAYYLGWGNYGLLWITIHDANLNLKYDGAHNVSSLRQFDQTFTAYKGWRISISITNDTNTRTICSGGATV